MCPAVSFIACVKVPAFEELEPHNCVFRSNYLVELVLLIVRFYLPKLPFVTDIIPEEEALKIILLGMPKNPFSGYTDWERGICGLALIHAVIASEE